MARSDLPARLRAQARGPLWDDNLAQVRALLREAAQRIDELEAPERAAVAAIELATVTGHTVGEIIQLFERLSAMDPKPLTRLSESRPKKS